MTYGFMDYSKFSVIQRIIEPFTSYQHDYLLQFVNKCQALGFSLSKTRSRCIVMADIVKRFPLELCDDKYDLYFSSKSQFEKLEIRRGSSAVDDLKRKYSARPRRKEYVSVLSVSYWTRKGKSEEEAKNIISKIQSERVSSAKRVFSLPRSSLKYWTMRGYSISDAKQLRRPFNENNGYDLDKFIKKFGDAEGMRRWAHRTSSRRHTMMQRYGTMVLSASVSKESIKAFLPLYKRIRRIGIQRHDVFWGIGGSREYATRFKNRNYFFDFVVHSKKLVVEYNNVFWHYRIGEIWNNPFYSKEESEKRDTEKRNSMEMRGYTVMYIWNDDDVARKIEDIVKWIEKN